MNDEAGIQEGNEMAFVIKSGWDDLQKLCDLDESDFLLSLHKLSNANLVKQIVDSYVRYMGGKIIYTFYKLKNLKLQG